MPSPLRPRTALLAVALATALGGLAPAPLMAKPAAAAKVDIPFEQFKDTWALPDGLVIRTAGDPAAITPAVRRVIAAADAEQPVAAVTTMDETLAKDVLSSLKDGPK